MSRFPVVGVFAALIAISVPAFGYKIGSAIPTKEADNLHETFTAVAGECLRARGWPADCSDLLPAANDRATKHRGHPNDSVEYASRWPDDPTRMLDAEPSAIRFGAQFFDECSSARARGPTIDRVGLLCSSHFGRLQFLHAQASGGDDYATTRRKILAWADFAYRAATDARFRAEDYCHAVGSVPGDEFRAALAFSTDVWCRPRPRRFLGIRVGSFPAFTVRSFFTLRCPNPAQEWVCWQRNGSRGDALAQAAAVGALLHLVQDSYSQSHVARAGADERIPGARGPFQARVVCRAPSRYYDYVAQNAPTEDDVGAIPDDPHGVADLQPDPHPTCAAADRQVDDLITASAAVLHFTRPENINRGRFLTYLENCVFPDAEALSRRSPGQRCFEVAPLSYVG